MKQFTSFLFLCVLLLGSCKKEVPVADVTFSVNEVTADTPTFTIEYTHDQSGGTAVASNNDEYWTSGKISLKQGQFISMKTTCTDPSFDLALSIFINGNLWKTGHMQSPTTSFTLSGDVPAE